MLAVAGHGDPRVLVAPLHRGDVFPGPGPPVVRRVVEPNRIGGGDAVGVDLVAVDVDDPDRAVGCHLDGGPAVGGVLLVVGPHGVALERVAVVGGGVGVQLARVVGAGGV